MSPAASSVIKPDGVGKADIVFTPPGSRKDGINTRGSWMNGGAPPRLRTSHGYSGCPGCPGDPVSSFCPVSPPPDMKEYSTELSAKESGRMVKTHIAAVVTFGMMIFLL